MSCPGCRRDLPASFFPSDQRDGKRRRRAVGEPEPLPNVCHGCLFIAMRREAGQPMKRPTLRLVPEPEPVRRAMPEPLAARWRARLAAIGVEADVGELLAA